MKLTLDERLKSPWLKSLTVALLLPGLVFLTPLAQANPTGGELAAGMAEIGEGLNGHLVIHQQSDRAIINWQEFSIAAGETTQFVQPGAGSMMLSRVVGGNPSAIYGRLTANGGHILVNTNGILVGPGGMVDVGGMNVLSTLDIDDANFMGGGDMRFFGNTAAGVTNFGTITSAGGDVILLGNFVDNQGSIGALNGVVALGAGGEILLHASGDHKISILRGGVGGETGVNNAGDITGAAVEMKAHGNVYALAVNNSGTIRATGASNIKGRVILSAPNGTIRNTGSIIANNADGSGGEILIDAPGGEFQMEGGEMRADGVGGKDGGTVTVTADVIGIDGGAIISADGGNGGLIQIGSPDSTSSVTIGDATITANGSTGLGGTINIHGNASSTIDIGARIEANGVNGGGTISVLGNTITQNEDSVFSAEGGGGQINIDAGTILRINGALSTEASRGIGGTINATGDRVIIGNGVNINASGSSGGGAVNIGGGFQGDDKNLRNSSRTDVGAAVIRADALGSGNAGRVVIWSDQDTFYGGDISASALGGTGNGGLIEVSGKETLKVWGSVKATAVGGDPGTVLFDPGDVNIGDDPGLDDITYKTINDTLQGGTSVIIATDGDINVQDEDGGQGGDDFGGVEQTDGVFRTLTNGGVAGDDNASARNNFIGWTNSRASLGLFAGEDVTINTFIRTPGAGSINIIGGWGGAAGPTAAPTGDFAVGGRFNPGFVPGAPVDFNTGMADVETIWQTYVQEGMFGTVGTQVRVGSDSNAVEVGSRFGNTNVAGGNIVVAAGQINGRSNRHSKIGWHDTGQVFAVRTRTRDGAGGNGGGAPGMEMDLNDRLLEFDDSPLVATRGFHEVDRNGDGEIDGVYLVNHTGVLDHTNPFATGRAGTVWDIDNSGTAGDSVIDTQSGAATFMPYAKFQNSSVNGNWWYHGLADDPVKNADGIGLGNLAPEHGAGGWAVDLATNTATMDASSRADINVIGTGSVVLVGGGRDNSSASIGHGGDLVQSEELLSRRENNSNSNTNERGQTLDYWSFNGSMSERTGHSIARLAPVYSNIQVYAGVNPDTVVIDRTTGNIAVDVTGNGSVTLQARQDMHSANVGGDDNNQTHNGQRSAVYIGHGGFGQFGSFRGDITVRAANSVLVRAGSQNDNWAKIGTVVNRWAYFDPADNEYQQLRFFKDRDDFDNPNLRRGELFRWDDPADGLDFALNTTLEPGATARSSPSYVIMDPRLISAAHSANLGVTRTASTSILDTLSGATNGTGEQVDLPINALMANDYDPLTETAATGMAASRPIIRGLNGIVDNTWTGDIVVEAASGDIQVIGFETPDTRDPTIGLAGTGTAAENGSRTVRAWRVAMIGHGGAASEAWTEHAGFAPTANTSWNVEYPRYRSLGGNGISSDGEDDAIQSGHLALGFGSNDIGRGMTWVTIQGDISLNAGNDVTIKAGNNILDFAQVGHGGIDLFDQETSRFVNGDITIVGGRDLVVEGGGRQDYTGQDDRNSFRSYAQVGHGGGYRVHNNHWSGDISIDMGRNIRMTSGSYDFNYSQIGHGGWEFRGQVGGNYETMSADNMAFNAADIGYAGPVAGAHLRHGPGIHPLAVRENFFNDGYWTNFSTHLTETGVELRRQSYMVNGSLQSNPLGFTNAGAPVFVVSDTPINMAAEEVIMFTGDDFSGNTANITVNAGGNILMDHLEPGDIQTDNSIYWNQGGPGGRGGNDTVNDNRVRWAWTQIGHGGRDTDPRPSTGPNPGFADKQYRDRIGNIRVTAGTAQTDASGAMLMDPAGNPLAVAGTGDIIMRNGSFLGYWTRIGHGMGDADRFQSNNQRGIVQAGTITVRGLNDVDVDASFASESDPNPANAFFGGIDVDGIPGIDFWGEPAQRNPVVIGHGGLYDNYDIITPDGETLNGLENVNSDIEVYAGGNMRVLGGHGINTSYAQVGHGFSSDLANDRANSNGSPHGFRGDIDVHVVGNLELVASGNAYAPGINAPADGIPVEGGYAAIGHGGHQLDAQGIGDIGVYVGGNLDLTASQRFLVDASTGDDFGHGIPIGSAFAYAQIGHHTSEFNDDTRTRPSGDPSEPNPNRTIVQRGARGTVDGADFSGNIVVVVGDTLTMTGGQNQYNDPNLNRGAAGGFDGAIPVIGATAQIGHGGISVNGELEGDITVLVKNDIITHDGTPSLPSAPGVRIPFANPAVGDALDAVHNYVHVGHGDWLKEGGGTTNSPFRDLSRGGRLGNVTVLAGDNVTLESTLIGHSDPLVNPGLAVNNGGNTIVGAGRAFPFWNPAEVPTAAGGILTAHRSDTGVGPLSAGAMPTLPDGISDHGSGSVITSGFYGIRDMRFYLAQREDNRLAIDGTTRVNTASTFYRGTPRGAATTNIGSGTAMLAAGTGGVSFSDGARAFDVTRGAGVFAGDTDEIYLQPDLWWDMVLGVSGMFPTEIEYDTAGNPVPGGAITEVVAPGGLPNLVGLTANGAPGSGTTVYTGSSSGSSAYAVYYDAIEPVTTDLPDVIPELNPTPPTTPPVIVPPVEEPIVVVIEELGIPVLLPVGPTPVELLTQFLSSAFTFDQDDRHNLEWQPEGDSLIIGIGLFWEIFAGTRPGAENTVGSGNPVVDLFTILLGWELSEDGEAETAAARSERLARYSELGKTFGVFYARQIILEENHGNSFKLYGRSDVPGGAPADYQTPGGSGSDL